MSRRLAIALLAALAGCVAARAAVDQAIPRGFNAPLEDPVQGGIAPAPSGAPSLGSPRAGPAEPQEPRGNPLWGIPLRSLTVTRERPLFTPSRRPPAPVVAGPPPVQAAPPPPPPAPPERPMLALVGAIVGERDGIAIFLDQTTNDTIRLRTGENHAGWVLRSVRGREATLVKDAETVVLSLPAPGDPPQAPGLPAGGQRAPAEL